MNQNEKIALTTGVVAGTALIVYIHRVRIKIRRNMETLKDPWAEVKEAWKGFGETIIETMGKLEDAIKDIEIKTTDDKFGEIIEYEDFTKPEGPSPEALEAFNKWLEEKNEKEE